LQSACLCVKFLDPASLPGVWFTDEAHDRGGFHPTLLFPQFFIMAPPKPSKQIQILLDEISYNNDDEKTHWDSVMDNFDMLFARLNDIGIIQHSLKTQLEDNNRRVDNFAAN
jgi:hypothetical protein